MNLDNADIVTNMAHRLIFSPLVTSRLRKAEGFEYSKEFATLSIQLKDILLRRILYEPA